MSITRKTVTRRTNKATPIRLRSSSKIIENDEQDCLKRPRKKASSALTQKHIKNTRHQQTSCTSRCENFVKCHGNENENAHGAHQTDNERRPRAVMTRAEIKSEKCHQQKNNQERKKNGVVDQEAESDCALRSTTARESRDSTARRRPIRTRQLYRCAFSKSRCHGEVGSKCRSFSSCSAPLVVLNHVAQIRCSSWIGEKGRRDIATSNPRADREREQVDLLLGVRSN